jgi:hypothetical protein
MKDEFEEFMREFHDNVMPQISESVLTLTIFSGAVDPKICLELGAAILYDKPIIVFATPDALIPLRLRNIASAIVVGEPSDPTVVQRLQDAMQAVMKENHI